MAAEENKAIVRRLVEEYLNAGNEATADELFAVDFVNHSPPVGFAADRDGFKQYIAMGRAAFPDTRTTIEDLLAEGEKVVLRTLVCGTHQGTFVGMPATGKQISLTAISILRLAGGQIVERWSEQDTLGLLQQLGVMPAPPPATT